MHDAARRALKDVIRQHGLGLANDPRRCGALLRDMAGQHRREISVLVAAAEEGVGTDLLRASQSASPALLAQLQRRLARERALSPEAAQWAVETWAEALALDSPTGQPVTAGVVEVSDAPVSATDGPAHGGSPDRPTQRTVAAVLVFGAAGLLLASPFVPIVFFDASLVDFASWLVLGPWGVALAGAALGVYLLRRSPQQRPASGVLGALGVSVATGFLALPIFWRDVEPGPGLFMALAAAAAMLAAALLTYLRSSDDVSDASLRRPSPRGWWLPLAGGAGLLAGEIVFSVGRGAFDMPMFDMPESLFRAVPPLGIVLAATMAIARGRDPGGSFRGGVVAGFATGGLFFPPPYSIGVWFGGGLLAIGSWLALLGAGVALVSSLVVLLTSHPELGVDPYEEGRKASRAVG